MMLLCFLQSDWVKNNKLNKDIKKSIQTQIYSIMHVWLCQNMLSNLVIALLILKEDTSEFESQWMQLTQLPVMNLKTTPLGVWMKHYLHSPTSINSFLAT